MRSNVKLYKIEQVGNKPKAKLVSSHKQIKLALGKVALAPKKDRYLICHIRGGEMPINAAKAIKLYHRAEAA